MDFISQLIQSIHNFDAPKAATAQSPQAQNQQSLTIPLQSQAYSRNPMQLGTVDKPLAFGQFSGRPMQNNALLPNNYYPNYTMYGNNNGSDTWLENENAPSGSPYQRFNIMPNTLPDQPLAQPMRSVNVAQPQQLFKFPGQMNQTGSV